MLAEVRMEEKGKGGIGETETGKREVEASSVTYFCQIGDCCNIATAKIDQTRRKLTAAT